MRRAAASLLFALACAQGGGAVSVTGSLLYRERIALPPGAVVRVTLADVSLIGVPERVLAAQEIRPTHQVPIPFVLTVAVKAIEPGRRYGVRATIHDAAGNLLWTTTEAQRVLPPNEVQIVLRQAGRLEREPAP